MKFEGMIEICFETGDQRLCYC